MTHLCHRPIFAVTFRGDNGVRVSFASIAVSLNKHGNARAYIIARLDRDRRDRACLLAARRS